MGSEMCIRDRPRGQGAVPPGALQVSSWHPSAWRGALYFFHRQHNADPLPHLHRQILQGWSYTHLTTPRENLDYDSLGRSVHNSILNGEGRLDETAVVAHSELSAPWEIAAGSFVVGIRNATGLRLAADLGLQQVMVRRGGQLVNACFLFGMRDRFFLPLGHKDATFLNRPWEAFLAQTGADPDALWPDRPRPSERCLWHARLFPVDATTDATATAHRIEWLQHVAPPDPATLQAWQAAERCSLGEILAAAQDSLALEDEWRRGLKLRDTIREVRHIVRSGSAACMMALFEKHAGEATECEALIEVLEAMAVEPEIPVAITTRALASVADVLAIQAAGRGGLRSGPARCLLYRACRQLPSIDPRPNKSGSRVSQRFTHVCCVVVMRCRNPAWEAAFQALSQGRIQTGVGLLTEQRKASHRILPPCTHNYPTGRCGVAARET